MRRVSSGYTIIEVMIFLAVSVALMASAFKLIDGKQAQTDFSQKVRDAQSQLQTWISNVSNGFTGADPSSSSCQLQGSRPEVIDSPPAPGYSPTCVYLGEAIQFTDKSVVGGDDSKFYAYSIFGCRLIGCGLSGNLPSNLQESNPQPAVGPSGGQDANSADLKQTFNLQPLHVSSVTPNTNKLIGFYNSINSDPANNGNNDLNAFAYPFSGDAKAADQAALTAVKTCLEMTSLSGACNLTNPPALNEVQLCLTDGSSYAVISITSSNGIGATVTLSYPDAITKVRLNC